MVEYAPYQKIPKKRSKRNDTRKGTLEKGESNIPPYTLATLVPYSGMVYSKRNPKFSVVCEVGW